MCERIRFPKMEEVIDVGKIYTWKAENGRTITIRAFPESFFAAADAYTAAFFGRTKDKGKEDQHSEQSQPKSDSDDPAH